MSDTMISNKKKEPKKNRLIRNVALCLSIFAIIAFTVFLVNQTAQLVALADRAHPLAGDIVFWSLLALYAVCITVPAFMIIRLPSPLTPPVDETSVEFEQHISRLAQRLCQNPLLDGCAVNSREQVEEALKTLDQRAEELTKTAGAQVFMTTAISQNGSLDGVIVLAAQTKLIYDVARVYNQRPALRDMLYLYGNVATTAYVAVALDDIDLSEQIQPVLASVTGSTLGGMIPGAGAVATLIVNSVMNGAANALLTMRVGVIAMEYSRALTKPSKKSVRRNAFVKATGMLGAVVADGGKRVANAIFKAGGNGITDAASAVADGSKRAVTATVAATTESAKWLGNKVNPFKKNAET